MMGERGDWTLVYSAGSLAEAELVRGRLQEHDIESVVVDLGPRIYPQLSEAEVRVKRADVIRALHLVRNPEQS